MKVKFGIQRRHFEEFKTDINILSEANPDHTINGLSLANLFDKKIWDQYFKDLAVRFRKLNSRLQKIIYLIDSRIHRLVREDYDSISPFEFEALIGDLFIRMGYIVELTPKSGNYGIDVIARKDKDVIAVQFKNILKETTLVNRRFKNSMRFKIEVYCTCH